jgi:hypothetical protein
MRHIPAVLPAPRCRTRRIIWIGVAWILGRTPAWISVPQRVPADVHVAIVVKDQPRVRDQRVGRDECSQRRVIVPGVVIQEPGAVLFLAGEGAVALQVGGVPGADGPIGVVIGSTAIDGVETDK